MTVNTRPVCVLVAAMGGEGGGVLADWLIDVATAMDFPVQSTSVPGVAQRTGATTYYVEIFPVGRHLLAGREPVLSLTPSPGQVDIVAASELVEAGRALQNGFVDAQRTLLVASTHREYAVSEKSAMGDGRYDGQRVLDAAQASARQALLFDMRTLAQRHGTVINTVLFGAMAGSGVLPVSRAACEAAIRRSGKGVEASLRGFAAGFDRAQTGVDAVSAPQTPRSHRPLRTAAGRILDLPEPVRVIAAAGVAQTTDYLDAAYATQYLDQLDRLASAERGLGGETFEVTREAARFLALWMSYEDVIRVADLKTRRERLLRVRREVGAADGEPLRLTEFLKPGVDEICSVLPTRLAAWLRPRLEARKQPLHKGLHLRTDTVSGFAMLCAMRALRPWRRSTSRYATEQAAITRWLGAVHAALRLSPALALELALCGNLVKGYGQTSERGHHSLATVLDDVDRHLGLGSDSSLVERIRAARQAALADPEGRQLAATLGLPRPEPKAQPIRIVRRRPAG
jgi:indolepyruvate ferredoxin oxidoreductase beta subunit